MGNILLYKKHPNVSIYNQKYQLHFAFFVFPVSCYGKFSVALPHGAVGLSAVCDCGIS